MRRSLREIVTIHEAGHAVAAELRSQCEILHPIVLTGDADHGAGITWTRSPGGTDLAFILWAGPWAEARLTQWPEGLPTDQLDEEGQTIWDHLGTVLANQVGDWEGIQQAMSTGPLPMTEDDLDRAVHIWDRELERALPAIRSTAARLLAGEAVTTTGVWDD